MYKSAEISVKQETYLMLKALSNACSTDPICRPALTHILYDHKKKQFIATDGHILRVEKYDVGIKQDFLIPTDLLKLTKKALKDLPEWIDLDIPENISPFPNWEMVIPDKFELKKGVVMDQIVLSMDLMARFEKSIVRPNHYRGLIFKFIGKLSPIGMFLNEEKDDGEREKVFKGVIMPLRGFDN